MVFENRNKWIMVLMSGVYSQGFGRLMQKSTETLIEVIAPWHIPADDEAVDYTAIAVDIRGHCCLGVAARAISNDLASAVVSVCDGYITMDRCTLTGGFAAGLGIDRDDQLDLASMNDRGVSHREIANILIEQTLTGLPIADLIAA